MTIYIPWRIVWVTLNGKDDPMKYYVAQETGSVYWLYHNSLMYAPLSADNTFDLNESGQVEDEASSEIRELYATVRKALA